MRPNYVLIDYENVQPDSLGLLDREEFRIRLFIGANQASLKRNVAIAMQKLGPAKAEYVEISGNGPNALDFHIAYYIGCLSAMDKDAFFHIISKDTGFDPLIAHLKSRKVFCQRSVRIEDIPLLRTLSAASAIEQADAVIDNLRRRGKRQAKAGQDAEEHDCRHLCQQTRRARVGCTAEGIAAARSGGIRGSESQLFDSRRITP